MSASKRQSRKHEASPPTYASVGILAFLTAIAVACWAYYPSLHGPFLFDDAYLPFSSPNAAVFPGDWLNGVRSALMFTYWINYRMSVLDPFSYHAVNLGLHFVNSILILAIVRRLLHWSGVAGPTAQVLPAVAALVFLLHPAQTEAVAYVAGRSELASSLWFFAAFTIFLYRKDPAVSWRIAVPILVLYGAAVLSKEQTVVLPAILLLTDLWWSPDFSLRPLWRNWKLYGPLACGAIGAGISFWTLITHATSAGFALKDLTWYQYFYTQWRALFIYLATFVMPVDLTADWDFPISRTPLDHGAILGLLALLFCAILAWKYRRRFRLASFGFIAFLLLMAPTSSILPIQDPVAERRLYFSMLALLLIAVDFASRIPWNRTAAAAAMAILIVGLAAATHARTAVWGNAVAFWEDTAQKAPNKPRPHFQLASAYYESGQCAQAVAEFERTAQLQKPRYDLLVDWGLACDCNNQPGPALEKLKQAAALNPTAHVYSQIAKVYGERSRWAEALDALATAENIDASYAMTYYYRAKIHLSTGRPALAVAGYQKALALQPTLQQARQELSDANAALAGQTAGSHPK